MKKWLLFFIGSAVTVVLLAVILPGHVILPQFFHIGPLVIHYYGITMAAAVVAGFYLAWKRKQQFGLPDKQAEDIIFWTTIGGFIGARVYHVLSSFSYYLQHPVDILKVWNGGLSIYGAVIGGVITLLLCKGIFYPSTSSGQVFQFSTFKLLDWLAPSVVLGQIIGRFGNLFNYELYGYPTNLPWKMFVPEQFRNSLYSANSFFHPLFLYEAIGNCVILFLLLKMSKKSRPGSLFFWALLLYNSLRFLLEFLRIDSVFIGSIRQNAVVSLVFIIVSAAGLIFYRNKNYAEIP